MKMRNEASVEQTLGSPPAEHVSGGTKEDLLAILDPKPTLHFDHS